jgi:pilus assembly protein CpaB
MRPVTILVVGLLASGTTTMLVYRAVQDRMGVKPATGAGPAVNVEVAPVVVAAGEVSFGATITEGQLKVIDWPKKALPANAFDARDKVAGRVAIVRMMANEPVTNEKLAPPDAHGLLALALEPGMRAVTVRVNEVAAVGGFITAGSHIDVLVTAEYQPSPQLLNPGSATPPTSAGPPERHTRTVLQNVTVLALGQAAESSAQPRAGEPLTTATLRVTPEQAELLALGSLEGTLQLVLRSFNDNRIVESPGARAQDLFARDTTPSPVATANRVEFIRGGERLTFPF